MGDLRERYRRYNPQASGHEDVRRELDQLMGDRYDVASETSLKNDFLVACFERIEPDQNWRDLLESHPNYESSWRPKKQRATALRMLLTEQVGWPEDQGLLSFSRKYLIGILLAVRANDEGIPRSETHVPLTLDPSHDVESLNTGPPERSLPSEEFATLVQFSNSIESDAESLLEERGIDATRGSHHIVYVLDCTPPVESEREAIESIRTRTSQKADDAVSLSEREAAAASLNDSKGILYVGYTHEFPSRMRRQHQGKASGSADFLNLYKPQRIVEISSYGSEGEARNRERLRADELRRETDWYVYQN